MITLKQLEDEIRLIAYQLYELRGKEPGHEVEDWLEAEKIVIGKYLKSEEKDKSAEAQLRRAEAGLAAEGTSVVTLAETSAMAGAEVEAEKAAEAAESEQKVEQPTGKKRARSASGGRRRGSTGKKSTG